MSLFTKTMLQNQSKTSSDVITISEGCVDFEKNVFSYSKDKKLDEIKILKLPSTLIEVSEIVSSDLCSLKHIVVNPDNTKFQSIDGVLYSKDGKELIKFPPARTGRFVVPYHVERISSSAFILSELEEIVLPSNLQHIADEAFCQCDKLQNIEIPDSVTCIEDKAFYMCGVSKVVQLPQNLTQIGTMAFSFPVQISENSVYKTDEKGNLFNKVKNTLILITNNEPEIDLIGDYEIAAFAGSNQTSVKLDGDFYVRECAFENCEELEIKGYPYIERNAFSENLKSIKINKDFIKFNSKVKLIDFYTFRDKYIIEYYTDKGYKVKVIPRKKYDKIPNFDEVRNYTRCRNCFFPSDIRNFMNKSYENDEFIFSDEELEELDILIQNEPILNIDNFRRVVELIKRAKYYNEDFYGLESGDFINKITPIRGNKYFDFVIKQILDDDSILNENKEEFFDFIYDFFEEYTYQLTGKTTTISYLDPLGDTRGLFVPAEDEVFINKSSINKFALSGNLFTSFHESSHAEQASQFELDIMDYKYYLMLKERLLEEYYSDSEDSKIFKTTNSFYEDNYEIELSELDADRDAIKFFRESLKLWEIPKEISEKIISKTIEYFSIKDIDLEAKTENKIFGRTLINVNDLFQASLTDMLVEIKDLFFENPALLIEFNQDGSPKEKIDILKSFSKFILDDSISKNKKKSGLDLYFGILIKDNTLLSKEQIIKEFQNFSEYENDNILVKKMKDAYLEKLERMMRTHFTNQLQKITTTQISDEIDARNFRYSMNSKRKSIRVTQIGELNQRLKSFKESSGLEDCK